MVTGEEARNLEISSKSVKTSTSFIRVERVSWRPALQTARAGRPGWPSLLAVAAGRPGRPSLPWRAHCSARCHTSPLASCPAVAGLGPSLDPTSVTVCRIVDGVIAFLLFPFFSSIYIYFFLMGKTLNLPLAIISRRTKNGKTEALKT